MAGAEPSYHLNLPARLLQRTCILLVLCTAASGQDRVIDLPGKATAVAPVGEGRYLAFYCPEPPTLGLVNLETRAMERMVTVPRGEAAIAGTRKHVFLGYQKKTQRLVQFHIPLLTESKTAAIGNKGVKQLVAGHASDGPVIVVPYCPAATAVGFSQGARCSTVSSVRTSFTSQKGFVFHRLMRSAGVT